MRPGAAMAEAVVRVVAEEYAEVEEDSDVVEEDCAFGTFLLNARRSRRELHCLHL